MFSEKLLYMNESLKLKIVNRGDLYESKLMKLDLYSTIALLFLTLVWVVYDIAKIKIGFITVNGGSILSPHERLFFIKFIRYYKRRIKNRYKK